MIRAIWLCDGAGYTYVAIDNDTGKLVGISQWTAPGRNLWDSLVSALIAISPVQDLFSDRENQRECGFNDFLQRLSEEGKAYVNGSVSYSLVSRNKMHVYSHFTQIGRDYPKHVDESLGIPQVRSITFQCVFPLSVAPYSHKSRLSSVLS